MADTKISDLAAVTDLIGTDEYVLARSGATKKIDASDLASEILALGSGSSSSDGWAAAGETWTYASADSPTFTFTVAADVTTKYAVGQRIKLTQSTEKFFIVTKVSTFSGGNTTITVYGGTDYTLANATITNPYWSMVKAPFGFPLNPDKWTVTLSDSTRRSVTTPSNGTWYNAGSLSISIPIGVWDLTYWAIAYSARATATTMITEVTLSTANNSESDTDMTNYSYANSLAELSVWGGRRKTYALTSKTSYYVNILGAAASLTALALLNDLAPLRVRAISAYL